MNLKKHCSSQCINSEMQTNTKQTFIFSKHVAIESSTWPTEWHHQTSLPSNMPCLSCWLCPFEMKRGKRGQTVLQTDHRSESRHSNGGKQSGHSTIGKTTSMRWFAFHHFSSRLQDLCCFFVSLVPFRGRFSGTKPRWNDFGPIRRPHSLAHCVLNIQYDVDDMHAPTHRCQQPRVVGSNIFCEFWIFVGEWLK